MVFLRREDYHKPQRAVGFLLVLTRFWWATTHRDDSFDLRIPWSNNHKTPWRVEVVGFEPTINDPKPLVLPSYTIPRNSRRKTRTFCCRSKVCCVTNYTIRLYGRAGIRTQGSLAWPAVFKTAALSQTLPPYHSILLWSKNPRQYVDNNPSCNSCWPSKFQIECPTY